MTTTVKWGFAFLLTLFLNNSNAEVIHLHTVTPTRGENQRSDEAIGAVAHLRQVAISSIGNTVLALDTGGRVWEWTRPTSAQNTGVWRELTVPLGVKKVATGTAHTLALLDDGTLWSSGDNSFGQLGNGCQASCEDFAPIKEITDIIDIAAGEHFSLALDRKGKVWVWGSNSTGIAPSVSERNIPTPVLLNADASFTGLVVKANQPIAFDGMQLWTWGKLNWYAPTSRTKSMIHKLSERSGLTLEQDIAKRSLLAEFTVDVRNTIAFRWWPHSDDPTRLFSINAHTSPIRRLVALGWAAVWIEEDQPDVAMKTPASSDSATQDIIPGRTLDSTARITEHQGATNPRGLPVLSSPSTTMGPTAASNSIGITSSQTWTAVSSADWLTTSPATGNGPGVVNYSVTSNPRANGRQGSIAVAGRTFGVAQASSSGSFTPWGTSRYGDITTVAGSSTVGDFSGDGNSGISAKLNSPGGTAIDGNGNVFVADRLNHRIRRIDSTSGVISTVVGTGEEGFIGDGGLATAAQVSAPHFLAVTNNGDLYFSDTGNNRIRKVSASSGRIATIAGNGSQGFGGDGGSATQAELNTPMGISVDLTGNVYFADYGNNRIRKISAVNGTILTVGGNGARGFSGDGATSIAASLDSPVGLAMDSDSNIYFSDLGNHRIRMISALTGIISTVAGNGTVGTTGDGGPASAAQIAYPVGVAIDSESNLYVTGLGNSTVRKVEPTAGLITTVAGGGAETSQTFGDGGTATQAWLKAPWAVSADFNGNLVVSDTQHNRLRFVDFATTTLSLSQSTITLPPNAGNTTLSITVQPTSGWWTASGGADWVNLERQSGNGSQMVPIRYLANGTASPRTATILVGGRSVVISQAGATPGVAIIPITNTVSQEGLATGTITVTANLSNYAWSAVASDSWIKITSATGIGNGAVVYQIQPNVSVSSRTGTISIADRTFSITQTAATASYTIAPTSAAVSPTAGSGAIQLSVIPGDGTWTAATNVAWLNVTPTSGAGPATLTYQYLQNTNSTTRNANITIAGRTFTLTQAGIAGTVTLTPASASVPAQGTAIGSISIGSNATDFQWSALASDTWITLAVSNGTGNGTVTYQVQPNTGASSRTGTITIADRVFTISQSGVTPTFSLTPASVVAEPTAGGGTFALTVTPSDGSWHAASAAVWLNVSPTSGAGPATIAFQYSQNVSSAARTGVITIGERTFTVTQTGIPGSVTLAPASSVVPAQGTTTGTISITSNATDYGWTAIPSDNWITVSAASGTGNGIVTFQVLANTSANPRTGRITIADRTFTVSQNGVAPTFSISQSSVVVDSAAGTGTFGLTVLPGDGTWSVASNVSWLTVSPASGTGSTTLTYQYSQNANSMARTGTLTVADRVFTVTQVGTTGTLTLTPASISVSAQGTTIGTISISANASDYAWNSVAGDNWITVSNGSGIGNGTVNYQVQPNPSANVRTGRITIGDRVFTVTQNGAPTTFSFTAASSTVAASAGSGTFGLNVVPGDATWNATTNVAWLSVSPANGVGSATLTYQFSQNLNSTGRTGTIALGEQRFTVTQAGVLGSITLTPSSASVSAQGTTNGTISIASNANDYQWTAVTGDNWITISSGIGAGNGVVTYQVQPNTTATARSGRITIAERVFTISQSGVTPIFSLTLDSALAGSTAGGGTFGLLVNPNDVPWTAVSNSEWLIVAQSTGTGSGTISYRYLENQNAQPRTGQIRIGDKLFTVNQSGAQIIPNQPPTISTGGPANPSGSPQTFTIVAKDPNGGADIKRLYFLIGADSVIGSNGCHGFYDSVTNSYALYNDSLSSLLGPAPSNGTRTIENSNCAVGGSTTTPVTVTGNDLTIAMEVRLKGTYATQQQKVFVWAIDAGNLGTGWIQVSTWSPTAPQRPPTLVSSAPLNTATNPQTFSFTAQDPNGASDISRLYFLVNDTTNISPGSCHGFYDRKLGAFFLYNDALTLLLGPLTSGSSAPLQNNSCVIDGATSTLASSTGNELTVNLGLRLIGTLATKPQHVYAWITDTADNGTGWLQTSTWTPSTSTSNQPPMILSASPATPVGSPQTFTIVARDGNGGADIKRLYFLIGSDSTVIARNGCHGFYDGNTNSFYLYNDALTSLVGALASSSSSVIENSNCAINGSTSTPATVAGTDLTVTMGVRLKGAYVTQQQKVFVWAVDAGNLGTGWIPVSTWNPSVILTQQPPTLVSSTPLTTTANPQLFSFTAQDPNGASDISRLYFLVNDTKNIRTGSCHGFYDRTLGVFYLYNDSLTLLQGPLTPGSSSALQNSSCVIDGATSVPPSVNGNELTINLGLRLIGAFAARPQNVYAWITDTADNGTGWLQTSTWTPSTSTSNQPPMILSASPATPVGSPQTFTIVARDGNGGADIKRLYFLIGTDSTVIARNGCHGFYDGNTNSFYLYNDALTSLVGALASSSSSVIENSNCAINGSTSNPVTVAGTDLTITMGVRLKGAYVTQQQKVFVWAVDAGNLGTGWIPVSTWNPSATLTQQPPTLVSSTPLTTTANAQIFSFTARDPNGASDISRLYFLVNTDARTTPNACHGFYDRRAGTFYLYNDALTLLQGPLTPGSSAVLQNSSCMIDGAMSTPISSSGNDLTVTLGLRLIGAAAAKPQKLFVWITDSADNGTGWLQTSTWTPATTVTNGAPSVSPDLDTTSQIAK